MTDAGSEAELEIAARRALDRLGGVLTGFDNQLDSVRSNHGDDAASGSIVARDLSDETLLATPELRRPLLDAFGFATVRMIAATDHLVVLARAIKAPPRPFAPQTLVRQGVELAARAWYLLDPAIRARERAARFVTELLHSLWETELAGWDMTNGSSPKDRARTLLRWAETVGLETCTNRRGLARVGKNDRPGSTVVISQMMGDLGAVGYRFFSSPAHGGIAGLANRLAPDPGENDVGAQVTVSAADAALAAAWAVMGMTPAFERYFELYGWDDEMTVRWRAFALKTAREIAEATGLIT